MNTFLFPVANVLLSIAALAPTVGALATGSVPVGDVKTVDLPSAAPTIPNPTLTLPADARRAPPAVARAAEAFVHVVDRSHVHYDEPGDGALWARGASWKASFGPDGVTYFPAFGRRAPHDVAHRLSPDVVRVGNRVLALANATASRAGNRVEVDRGVLVERYELAPGSIEQELVFASLPAPLSTTLSTSDELVVRIPIASELEARETDDGFEFRSELGRVTYGRATAIDASGRHAPVAASLSDGAIVLHVDAAFVAGATFPLVIDPVVTTITIEASTSNDASPDVAYDASSHRWLVAYAEFFSSTDTDVYHQMFDDSGAAVSGGYVDITSNSWDHPRCANLAFPQQFLVVASVSSGTSQKIIRGRNIAASTDSMGAQFTISSSETGDLINPDVGGDPSLSASACYCVVYERIFNSTDDDIIFRLVGSDATTHVGPNFISNSSSTMDQLPSVSKSDDGSTWLLAWQRQLTFPQAQIWMGRVRADGVVLTPPTALTSALLASYLPCASSPLHGTQRAAIVYEAITSPTQARLLLLDAGTLLSETDVYNPFGNDQTSPSVDSDGQQFTVVYAEQPPAASQHDVFECDFGMSGTSLLGTQFRVGLGTTASDEEIPRLASAHGAGGPARRYFAAWEKLTSASNTDVYGALLDAQEGGPVFGFCFGDGSGTTCPCGNNGASGHGCANSVNPGGATLFHSGFASTITDTFVIQATGMPASTSCLFFQGTAPTSPVTTFGDGLRCVSGGVIRLGTKATSGGVANYPESGDAPISVRGQVPVDGATRYYQVWYRNSASFCTSATFNTSSAMIVEWTR